MIEALDGESAEGTSVGKVALELTADEALQAGATEAKREKQGDITDCI